MKKEEADVQYSLSPPLLAATAPPYRRRCADNRRLTINISPSGEIPLDLSDLLPRKSPRKVLLFRPRVVTPKVH